MTTTSAKGSGAIGTIGSVALGITTASTNSGPYNVALTLRNMVVQGGTSRRVKSRVASSGSTAAAAATSGGRFGYDPDREFIVLGYSSKINGTANTLLSTTGSKGIDNSPINGQNQKAYGAMPRSAWASGNFSFVKIPGQRSNWAADSGQSVLAGGILNSQAAVTYKSTTSASTASNDKAINRMGTVNGGFTVNAVTGRIIFRSGARGQTTTSYPAFTGP